MRLIAFALVALIAVPASAQTFRAENQVDVVPTAGGFAVQNGGGFGARGMWCAAADFARDRLGARGVDRIYVRTGRTPGVGQRAPVEFTLDPAGLTPSSVLIAGSGLRTPGANLSVDHAHIFCDDAKGVNR